MINVRFVQLFVFITLSAVFLGCPRVTQTYEQSKIPKAITNPKILVPEWDLGDLSLFAAQSGVVAISESSGEAQWAVNTPKRVYDYQIRDRIKSQGNDYVLVTWIDNSLRPWTAIIQLNTDNTKDKLIFANPDTVLLEDVPRGDFVFTISLDFNKFNGLELGYINAVSVANGAQKSFPDLCMPIAEATPGTPLVYKPSVDQPGDLILIGPQIASESTIKGVKKEFEDLSLHKSSNNNSKINLSNSDKSNKLAEKNVSDQTAEDKDLDSFLRSMLPIEEFAVARVSTVDASLIFKNKLVLPKKISYMSVLTLVEKYLLVTGMSSDETTAVVFAIDVESGNLAWFNEYPMTLATYPVPGDLGFRVPFDYQKGRFLLAWYTDEGNIELTSIALTNGKTIKSRIIEQDADKPTLSSILSVWSSRGNLYASDKLEGKNENWKKLELGFSNQYWDGRNGVLHNPPLDLHIKTSVWGRARLTELGTGKALKVGRHWIDPFDGSILKPDLSIPVPEEVKRQSIFPGSFFVERKIGDLLIIRRYGVPFPNEFSENEHLFMIYSISNKNIIDSDFSTGLSSRYLSEFGLIIDAQTFMLLDKLGQVVWKTQYNSFTGFSSALVKK